MQKLLHRRTCRRKRARVSAGLRRLALGGMVAAANVAQAAVSYPPSLDARAIGTWLQESTDLAPDQVIALTPSAVTAMTSLERGPEGVQVTLRAQALTQDAVTRSGVLAWDMRATIDCLHGKVRLGVTTGYLDRRNRAQGVMMAPADPTWRTPPPATPLESASRFICDPALSTSRLNIARSIAAPEASASQSPGVAAPEGPVRSASPARTVLRDPPGPTPRVGRVVQVVSSTSAEYSRGEVAKLRARFAAAFAGRSEWINRATLRGRPVYRGMVVGFGSQAEAKEFCRTLTSAGHGCLLR